jgi:hypothetical protein
MFHDAHMPCLQTHITGFLEKISALRSSISMIPRNQYFESDLLVHHWVWLIPGRGWIVGAGAGILSSAGETKFSLSMKTTISPYDAHDHESELLEG